MKPEPKTPVVHKQCERCLEPKYKCVCLETDLEEFEAPDVAWVASRPIGKNAPVKHEFKYRYEKASREVERLNRLYAGRVQHFLLPVNPTGGG